MNGHQKNVGPCDQLEREIFTKKRDLSLILGQERKL